MERIRIGDRWVGAGAPAYVIAEAGSNHDRKHDQALRLIDAAAAAGADAVKFQLFKPGDLYPSGTQAYEVLDSVALPYEWVPTLAEAAQAAGLDFLASCFSRESIDLLVRVRAPGLKWASSETVNLPLLRYAAATEKPILLSTGMCDLADVHEAVEVVLASGGRDIILLQCTSLYPSPANKVHLRAMDTLREAFRFPVGFSDHTTDLTIPAAAVARGACLIEKHLTLDRTLPGPDHSYALEPSEFAEMIQAIRRVEEALGSPMKTMLPEEGTVARRDSLRAARDIDAGEVLTQDAVTEGRPGDGVRTRFLKAVIGQRARVRMGRGEAITWEKIKSPE